MFNLFKKKEKKRTIMDDFDDMKKSLIDEYGEDVGLKMHVELLAACANGRRLTEEDNPISNYKRSLTKS